MLRARSLRRAELLVVEGKLGLQESVGHHCRKEQAQIEDGVSKHPDGRSWSSLAPQPYGKPHERPTERSSRQQVKQPHARYRIQQESEEDKHDRVNDNLPPGFILSGNDRQHRNVRAGVVVAAEQRQGPKVWGRPEKDNNEEKHRSQVHVSRGGRPSDKRGHGTGSPADDDILWRGTLQPDRIDKYIKEKRRQRQESREQVHQYRHLDECHRSKQNREREGIRGGNSP